MAIEVHALMQQMSDLVELGRLWVSLLLRGALSRVCCETSEFPAATGGFTKVVAVTADAFEGTRDECMSAGFDGEADRRSWLLLLPSCLSSRCACCALMRFSLLLPLQLFARHKDHLSASKQYRRA